MKEYLKLYIVRFKNQKFYTIGKFILIDERENIIQEGYTLEPEYPDTIKPNQNKRIPNGLYQVDNTIYSHKFKQILPTLYSPRVSKNRRILIHSGNERSHTQGCILVGEKLNQEQNQVLNSKLSLNKLKSHIKDKKLIVQIF